MARSDRIQTRTKYLKKYVRSKLRTNLLSIVTYFDKYLPFPDDSQPRIKKNRRDWNIWRIFILVKEKEKGGKKGRERVLFCLIPRETRCRHFQRARRRICNGRKIVWRAQDGSWCFRNAHVVVEIMGEHLGADAHPARPWRNFHEIPCRGDGHVTRIAIGEISNSLPLRAGIYS